MKLTITTGTEKDFFERGKKIARKLDQGESVEPECVISFEEPQEPRLSGLAAQLLRRVIRAENELTNIKGVRYGVQSGSI